MKFTPYVYFPGTGYICLRCKKVYKHDQSLRRHLKFECGKLGGFFCPIVTCSLRSRYKCNVRQHIYSKHKELYDALRDAIPYDATIEFS